jgi:predicted negative regulator of RcsB-dependent stress response
MVDEYLSEREQAEQLRHWLRENWIWLLAGVALTLGGYYGYQWWETRQSSRSQAAEQRFSAMLEALARNQPDEGVRIAGEVTGEFAGTPYADQATLVLARLDVEAGNFAGAEARLAAVAADSGDPELRLVARLRLARVQLAQGRHDDAMATLDAAGTPAIEPRIEELRGDVWLARGDRAAALASYRKAQAAAGSEAAAQGLFDAELLGLKIDELAAATTTATEQASP